MSPAGGGCRATGDEYSTIGRRITVTEQTVVWMGVMFGELGGNAALLRITVQDEHPGAPRVYIVSSTIGRNLSRTGLVPGACGGFVPGAVHVSVARLDSATTW